MDGSSKENSEFEKIFEALTDILQYTVENMDQPMMGAIPDDLELRLSNLEKDIHLFCAANKILNEQNPKASSIDHLTKSERRSLERSQKLLREGEEKLAEANKKEGQVSAEKIPKKKISSKEAHKKQYRRMGGNKNWKPL